MGRLLHYFTNHPDYVCFEFPLHGSRPVHLPRIRVTALLHDKPTADTHAAPFNLKSILLSPFYQTSPSTIAQARFGGIANRFGLQRRIYVKMSEIRWFDSIQL
jgi:hypothetical protein